MGYKITESFKSETLNNYKNVLNSSEFRYDLINHLPGVELSKLTEDDFILKTPHDIDELDLQGKRIFCFRKDKYLGMKTRTNLADADFYLIFDDDSLRLKYPDDDVKDKRSRIKPFAEWSGSLKNNRDYENSFATSRHKDKKQKVLFGNTSASYEEKVSRAISKLTPNNIFALISTIHSMINSYNADYYVKNIYSSIASTSYNKYSILALNPSLAKSVISNDYQNKVSYESALNFYKKINELGAKILQKIRSFTNNQDRDRFIRSIDLKMGTSCSGSWKNGVSDTDTKSALRAIISSYYNVGDLEHRIITELEALI